MGAVPWYVFKRTNLFVCAVPVTVRCGGDLLAGAAMHIASCNPVLAVSTQSTSKPCLSTVDAPLLQQKPPKWAFPQR